MEITSVFDVIAADETNSLVASRQAAVVAKIRCDERYETFIKSAGSFEDFKDRLAYLEEDIKGISAIAGEEFAAPDPIESVLSSYNLWASQEFADKNEKTASIHESRKPKMCDFHSDVVDISLAQGDPRAGFDAMSQHWGGSKHCKGDDYAGVKCNFKPQMTTQSFWDEKSEKAEERKQQRLDELQQIPEEAVEPVLEADEPLDNVEEFNIEPSADIIDFPSEPSAVGEGVSEEIPMSMAASTKQSADFLDQSQGGTPQDTSQAPVPNAGGIPPADGLNNNPELMNEARNWLADLSWADAEPEDFHNPSVITDDEVKKAVEKYYEGGLPAFLEASSGHGPENPYGPIEQTHQPFGEVYQQERGQPAPPQGSGVLSSFKEANQWIRKQGDKWVIIQKGSGDVLSHHDSKEQAEASFSAMEANKHSKNAAEDNLGGKGTPEPKIDKRKWTPQTVKKIDDVDSEDGPNPSKEIDIIEPIIPNNSDKLTDIGENHSEHQTFPNNKDDAGFSDGGVNKGPNTKTFPNKGQAKPVTSDYSYPQVNEQQRAGRPNPFGAEFGGNIEQSVQQLMSVGYSREEAQQIITEHPLGGSVPVPVLPPPIHYSEQPVPQTEGGKELREQINAIRSSKAEDIDKNPIQNLLDNGFEGFIPNEQVQTAINAYRR